MKIKSDKITAGYTFKNKHGLIFTVISGPEKSHKATESEQINYIGPDAVIGRCSVRVLEFFEEIHYDN